MEVLSAMNRPVSGFLPSPLLGNDGEISPYMEMSTKDIDDSSCIIQCILEGKLASSRSCISSDFGAIYVTNANASFASNHNGHPLLRSPPCRNYSWGEHDNHDYYDQKDMRYRSLIAIPKSPFGSVKRVALDLKSPPCFRASAMAAYKVKLIGPDGKEEFDALMMPAS